MNLADLQAELEADREWREDELRTFQNRGSAILDAAKRDQYRRVLVLLLYAHYEGFCKFAFTLYAAAVNRSQISCREASYAVAAASLSQVFRDLRNPDKKSAIFKHDLPDDTQIHKFAREREFIERTAEIETRPVSIPDDAIDMQSNLTPTVLRKNLFRLGLPHDEFDSHSGEINMLLAMRNGISHGSRKDGVGEQQYEKLKTAAYSIMSGLSAGLMKALTQRAYLR